MAKSTKEKRYIRIEDWLGNYYFPEGQVGESTAGKIMDASEASTDPSSGATTYTQGTKTPDAATTSGTSIIVTNTSGAASKIIYSTIFNNLVFGKVSLGMRLKSSIGSGTTPIIAVQCYCVNNVTETKTLISTTNFNGNDIGKANEFINLGMITDFSGISNGSVSLQVQVYLLGVNCTITFDNLSACVAVPSTYAIKDQNGNVIDAAYATIASFKSKGDSQTPVYFDANGVAHPITYFNGTAKKAESADAATKATNDSDGNKISTTYSKKADIVGGSATTPIYVDSTGKAQTITSYGGNSATATKLKSKVNITVGSKTQAFDGSGAITFSIADIGIPLPKVDGTKLIFK